MAPLCTQSPELSDCGCSAPYPKHCCLVQTQLRHLNGALSVWPPRLLLVWRDSSSGGMGKATQELTASLLTATEHATHPYSSVMTFGGCRDCACDQIPCRPELWERPRWEVDLPHGCSASLKAATFDSDHMMRWAWSIERKRGVDNTSEGPLPRTKTFGLVSPPQYSWGCWAGRGAGGGTPHVTSAVSHSTAQLGAGGHLLVLQAQAQAGFLLQPLALALLSCTWSRVGQPHRLSSFWGFKAAQRPVLL